MNKTSIIKKHKFFILILSCMLLLLLSSYFIFFSNTSNPTNENLQTCTFNKYEFSNYFEKGKNIQLVPKDIYIFPETENIKCLGKVLSYDVDSSSKTIYAKFGTNPKVYEYFYYLIFVSLALSLIFLKLNRDLFRYCFLLISIFVAGFEIYYSVNSLNLVIFIGAILMLYELSKVIYYKTELSNPIYLLILFVTPIFFIFHFIFKGQNFTIKMALLFLLIFTLNYIIFKNPNWLLAKYGPYFSLASISFLINFGSFKSPIKDFHAFRQSQTAIASRVMFEDNLSILTPGPYFGIDAKVPFEFPFLQLFSAILQKIGIQEVYSLRPLAWLLFISFLFLFYNFLIINTNKEIASYVAVLTLFNPLVYIYQNAFLIEFIPHIFGIIALGYFYKNKNSMSAIFLSLSLLGKVTTGFLYALIISLFYFFNKKFDIKEFVKISLIILIPNSLWIFTRESTINSNPLTVWLSSDNLGGWNFTYKKDILNFDYWFELADKYIAHFWNTSFVIGLFLFILIFINNKFLIVTIVPVIIFSNLYQVHDYYFLAIIPLILFFLSDFTYKKIANYRNRYLFIILLIIASSYGQMDNYIARKSYENFEPYNMSKMLRNYEQTNVYLASDLDWNPSYFFEANKRGIMWQPKYYERGQYFEGKEFDDNNIQLFIFQKNFLNQNHLINFLEYQHSKKNNVEFKMYENFIYLSETTSLENNNVYIAPEANSDQGYIRSCKEQKLMRLNNREYHELTDYNFLNVNKELLNKILNIYYRNNYSVQIYNESAKIFECLTFDLYPYS